MNNQYTYFLILAGSICGPLALSFDKKVGFYKKWKYLFPAMVLPALFYVIWDIIFTALHIWHFNPLYITGIKLVNLPVEEVLFFVVVPYCCVFIYDCICTYLPDLPSKSIADLILKILGLGLFLLGIIYLKKTYTSCTFIFTAVFISSIYLKNKFFKLFNAAAFLISYGIILIPFLIVNGFLTAIPVVIYDNSQNLGLRIYTIPVEDIFYGMLLTILNTVIYDRLKNNNKNAAILKIAEPINLH